MSDSIIVSDLLVDLSTEQEEAIAGGLSIGSGDDIELFNKVATNFSEKKLATLSTSKSGPGGAEVTRAVGASAVKSGTFELFDINV